MNLIIKISEGPKVVDFQLINIDPNINTVEEVNELITKAFEEYRTTFQEPDGV